MSEALIEIMPINWQMARCRPWRTHIVSLYLRTRHLLLRFLCRKEPCRQREELGSKRSVSFPIQRTRVTRVTRDVLFHRFTYAAWAFTLWERYTKHAKLKTLFNNEPINIRPVSNRQDLGTWSRIKVKVVKQVCGEDHPAATQISSRSTPLKRAWEEATPLVECARRLRGEGRFRAS